MIACDIARSADPSQSSTLGDASHIRNHDQLHMETSIN